MQITKVEKTRLGIFIVTTLTLAAISLFYMVGKRMMIKEDPYYVVFSESVAGLNPGANVKLNGVNVGRVTGMFADTSDVRKVIVHFVVKHGTPVKSDMVANMTGGMSITGLKTIELSGGSNEVADVPVGGEVRAGISQLKMLTGQAEAIALKFETLLNNILNLTNEEHQALATGIIKIIYGLSVELDSLVKTNRQAIWDIPKNLAATMQRLQTMATKAESILNDIKKADPGKKLEQTMAELQATGKDIRNKIKKTEIDKTVREFQKAAVNISDVAGKLDQTLAVIQEDLGSIMTHIKETAENMEDFSRTIKENPSLLLRGEDKKERGL